MYNVYVSVYTQKQGVRFKNIDVKQGSLSLVSIFLQWKLFL